MRRRDDARLHRSRLALAHALERALLEHAQELRLDLRRELGHFVEQERALARELDAPRSIRHGARESTSRVPEELALQQAGGHRSAVQGDEGRVARGPRRMQRPRDELLAGTALAEHEHRRARGRDATDLVEERSHGRAAPHEQAVVLDLARHGYVEPAPHLAFRDRARHHATDTVHVERLHEELVRALCNGVDRRLHVVATAHHHSDRCSRPARVREQLETVPIRESEVEEQEVVLALRKCRDAARDITAFVCFMTQRCKQTPQRRAQAGVILYEEHSCHRPKHITRRATSCVYSWERFDTRRPRRSKPRRCRLARRMRPCARRRTRARTTCYTFVLR
jgi:hypothetical protein